MKLKNILILVLVAGSLSQLPAASGSVSFAGLGDLQGGAFSSQAYDVSADGSVVVGRSVNSNGYVAFYWTEENGMLHLGSLDGNPVGAAYAISGDGSVIVGYGYSENGTESENVMEAFRWTEESGMVPLGDLGGGEFRSSAFGVSWDGSIVVGNGQSKKGSEAFFWILGKGMDGLGDLEGDIFHSYANDVSNDGSIVCGTSYSKNGYESYIWLKKKRKMYGLGDIPGGNFRSVTAAISADGSAVVGHSDTPVGTKAFRWTEESGMLSLGDLQGGFSMATDVSGDGSVVVGFGEGPDGIMAFVWDVSSGMRSLKDALVSRGVDMTGWKPMHAEAVSNDGNTVVGYGINPEGELEAFVAVIN